MKKVEITGPAEEVVDRLIASGRCEDANQVVEISLRLLDKEEMERQAKLEALREGVLEGIADVEAGRVAPMDMEAIKQEARRRFEQQHHSA